MRHTREDMSEEKTGFPPGIYEIRTVKSTADNIGERKYFVCFRFCHR